MRSAAVVDLERVKGIEPSSVAWEATALPLSYTRVPIKFMPPAAAHATHAHTLAMGCN